MKISKKKIVAFAMVLCLSLGVTAFAATYKCNLMYGGSKIGNGVLERSEKYGNATTYLNTNKGMYGVAIITAYNRSGKVLATGSNAADFCATKTISCKNPYKYRSTHSAKRNSDNRPLSTGTLYSFK